jgi:hypothetical protein
VKQRQHEKERELNDAYLAKIRWLQAHDARSPEEQQREMDAFLKEYGAIQKAARTTMPTGLSPGEQQAYRRQYVQHEFEWRFLHMS